MSVICPTVTAYTPEEYDEQVTLVSGLSPRIHVDVADLSFTPHETVALDTLSWGTALRVDMHSMSRRIEKQLGMIANLAPSLVVFHAEAVADIGAFTEALHAKGIQAGVALLQPTSVESIAPYVTALDHVLVFSGSLGSYGGSADLTLLSKVHQLRELKPELEIGWDGGISIDNAAQLVEGGVDVLNVGGAIQKANQPQNAYNMLVSKIA